MPFASLETARRERGAPCTLREACRSLGLDDDDSRCPDCALRTLCKSDRRWLVAAPGHGSPVI